MVSKGLSPEHKQGEGVIYTLLLPHIWHFWCVREAEHGEEPEEPWDRDWDFLAGLVSHLRTQIFPLRCRHDLPAP